MPFDINGAVLQAENAAIKIVTNGVTGLTFDSSGISKDSTRPYFVAQGTADWTNYSSGAWNDITQLGYVLINNGSHYNTGNGRFTASITGTYYFFASTYTQKYTATNADSYTHPIFRINGSYTARQASAGNPYRLRTRTYYSSSYSTDTQINDIFQLTAGDYVNYHIYSSAALRFYPPYSIFGGFLIG